MRAELKVVSRDDVVDLQRLSIGTFMDTFAQANAPEDIDSYIAEAFSSERLIEEITRPDSDFFLLLVDGEAVGYLKINILEAQTEDMGPDALEIQRIYVSERFKRHGFGRYMLAHALACARGKRMTRVWLGVWEHNLAARRFYEGHGFAVTGSHMFMLGADQQRDLIMERELD